MACKWRASAATLFLIREATSTITFEPNELAEHFMTGPRSAVQHAPSVWIYMPRQWLVTSRTNPTLPNACMLLNRMACEQG